MHKVYELKEMLCDTLEEYGSKGKLSAGELDIVDKLAHTIKNLDKIIEKYEEEGYSEREGYGYENRGGGYGYENRGGNRGGNRSGNYSREGGSYAMAQRRDSRGRYSSDNRMMISELRELMQDAPDERTRQEFQKFISKMEQM